MTKPISSEKYLRGAGLALKAGERGEAAEFFLKGGEFDTAALLFEKLEQHGRAAVAYAKAGQPLDAAAAWERAGEYTRAAAVYAEAGNIPEAARAYVCAGESIRAAELFAQSGRFLDAAKAASEANAEKTMIAYLQKVTPNDPDYREAALVLARALTRRGWSALAIETIERVLGKEPVREEALELWYELARAHEEHGELADASEILHRVLACQYDYREAESWQRRLRGELEARASELDSDESFRDRYVVGELLGRGVQGEVYKAKDTRLDRTVAVKVLPEHLAESPERKARFEREAKVISQLNHPHICTLYDVGEQDGINFIVMEYIEGETLAERLKKGALPLDKVLEYGIQIADGLDTAHRVGIVHRDVKPANAMLTKSGVKLLDFGLARLVEGDVGSASSDAPTQQKDLTKEESIIGTLQYMAPEQLERKAADARTDIFAFGAMLYEMITGKKVFEGKTQASLITAIMSSEPRPLSEFQPLSPVALERVVRKCLAKNRDRRWQTASDLKDELEWMREGSGETAPMGRSARKASEKRERLAWVAALLASVVVTAAIVQGLFVPSSPPPPVKRFVVPLPPNVSLPRNYGSLLALSPNGTKIIFVGFRDEDSLIFLHTLDDGESRALVGTEGARHPAFSPDGEFIAFDAQGQLFRLALAGGPRVALAEEGTYPAWGPDGSLFFWRGGIWRIPVAGGPPEALLEWEPGGNGRLKVLPNGKGVLFEGADEPSVNTLNVLSLDNGERRTLVTTGTNPHYVATGHILFARDGSLFAVPFDVDGLRLTGPERPILEDLRVESGGAAQFVVGGDGSLVYAREGKELLGNLVWVDRQGNSHPVTGGKHRFATPRLSPDGRRVAVTITDSNGTDIWVHEIGRDILTRLTFEEENYDPIWSPDGKRIAFRRRTAREEEVFATSAGGAGEMEQLSAGGGGPVPTSWSSDGRLLILNPRHETNLNIDVLRLEGNGEPEPLLTTRFMERQGALAPDDRWLAYTSNEAGRHEVFVVPFPDASFKRQISTDGGAEPRWSGNGRELFYRNGNRVMAVAIETEPELNPGNPELLFEGPFGRGGFGTNYDVTADGDRFLMIRQEEGREQGELQIVLNWFEELERLAPTEN